MVLVIIKAPTLVSFLLKEREAAGLLGGPFGRVAEIMKQSSLRLIFKVQGLGV